MPRVPSTPIGSKIINNIPSSNGLTYYRIIEGRDGVVYCECWGWKKNRTCKHLDQHYKLVGKIIRNLQGDSVKDAVEKAIQHLTE